MVKRTLDATVKNLLRSGQHFFKIRHRLISEIVAAPSERIDIKSTFLIATLLRINKDSTWSALSFSKDDWPVLKRLASVRTGSAVEDNLLQMAAAYVAANIARVGELESVAAKASSLVLASNADAIEPLIRQLDKIERQSLLVFKLFSAANAAVHAYVAKYFGEERHGSWVRQRFAYPLIFFTVNHPDPLTMDDSLLSIFPWLESDPSERQVVRYLLRTDFDHGDSLSFKCYAALMSHPYDALEMLTDHFEGRIASRAKLTAAEEETLRSLAEVFPDHRVRSLLVLWDGKPIEFTAEASMVGFDFELTEADREFFDGFFDMEQHKAIERTSKLLGPLGRLRWSRYPQRADFEAIVSLAGQYAFLPLGRVLDICLMSLYMVSRRVEQEENRVLIRCAHYFAGFTPFLLASPRGAASLQTALFRWKVPLAAVEAAIDAVTSSQSDRTWMKEFHWRTRYMEQKLRLGEYFSATRAAMRPSINSRFLSGVDWRWLQEVMDALKIGPFRNADGVYTLILRAVEERDRQPNYVRTALRPRISGMGSVSTFVDYLMDEYGRDSVAIVRAILTPDMILKMQLESYFAAALAERLDALTRCVERFGFDDEMLTEEQFLVEQKTLSTALALMNVHSAQFAVSWDVIRDAGRASASEMYTAFEAVNRTFNEIPLLSDAVRTSALTFANRQNAVYSLKNRLWPAAVIVEHIIDAFLSHPSHGIESILAVRIRHDNLRYEFGLVVDGVKRSRIPGVREADLSQVIPAFDAAITDAINRWVDNYMHTAPAPERKALFDFVPTESELLGFVEEIGDGEALDTIVTRVIAWLRERLSKHLETARQLLDQELRSAINQALAKAEIQMQFGGAAADRVERVKKALLAALNTRCDELREWFDSPPETQIKDVPFADIKLAVDGRYRSMIESERLRITLTAVPPANAVIAANSVRLVFDIWSELAKNAIKYSALPTARLRVWPYRTETNCGYVFSSRRAESDDYGEEIYSGEPTVSTSAAIFKSGRSGLPKVAHLAASVVGTAVDVTVLRRRSGFHVVVPLARVAGP